MEKVNLGYSIKDIPIPNEKNYLYQLVAKIEAVIKRMRWKAHFFIDKVKSDDDTVPEQYGLKSEICPGQVEELKPFENDLIQLVKQIKFRRVMNDFHRKLSDDLKEISCSNYNNNMI